jgi:antitoxin CptB
LSERTQQTMTPAADTTPAIDERRLSRLRWHCRRGLLENDLFIERFFARHGDHITQRQADGLAELMSLADNDLLDLLLQRKPADAAMLGAAAVMVLKQMQGPPRAHTPGDDRAAFQPASLEDTT